MRGIQLTEYIQSPDALKVQSLPSPSQKATEYLIQIEAAATNFFDILQIQGKYQSQPPFPWIAGAEFAGIVIALPPANSTSATKQKYKIGDRVFGSGQGAFAEKIACPEERLLPVPDGWTSFDAAGLFITAPTSYAALVIRAGIKTGDYVLVHAAAGGVGLAAVQIAKAMGATVIATTGSPAKQKIAQTFGADHVINYRDKNWADQVKKLTPNTRGVDIVYDPVGLIEQSMKCIAWNGRLLVIGFAAGQIEKVAMNRVLLKNVSLVGLHWGAYAKNEADMIVTVWKGIFKLIEEGKFRSTGFTDQTFNGLESVPRALNALGGRESWGKVVVNMATKNKSKI